MEFLRGIWQDLRSGQNIDSYITIFIALTVAVFGVTDFSDQKVVSATILATLALVSTGLLVNRHENKKLRNSIAQLDSIDHLADKFFSREYNRFNLQQLVRVSRQAFFWGITFSRTIPLLKDDLEFGIQNGLEIKILLLKPSSHAVEMAAFRSREAKSDELDATLQSNISKLLALSKKSLPGKLEVRYVNYLPPYTVICFDPYLASGRLFARLITFRVPNEIRPTFELTNENDNYWFSFFVQQFESVWKEAEPLN